MALTLEAKDAFDAIDVQPSTDDTGKPLQKPTAPGLDEIGKLALDLIPAAPAPPPAGPGILDKIKGFVSGLGGPAELPVESGGPTKALRTVPTPPPPPDVRQQALDQTKTDALGATALNTPIPPDLGDVTLRTMPDRAMEGQNLLDLVKTPEELQRDDLDERQARLTVEGRQLKTIEANLLKSKAAIQAAQQTLDRTNQQAIDAFNRMIDDYNAQLQALAPRVQAYNAAHDEFSRLVGQYNRAISPDFVERLRRTQPPQMPERPPLTEYEAGGQRLAEMAKTGNVLERLVAGAALGGKAAATQPFIPPAEGGEKDIAARIGQITALPFSVPFATLTNALVQAGAISPQTAEELAKLAMATLPATMGPEANAARTSLRFLRQDPGAAIGAMRPLSAWEKVIQGPEGPQVSRLVEALQQTAARGATAGERAAAEAGLDRILQRYGLTRDDIPVNLRVAAEPMQPTVRQPVAELPRQAGAEPPAARPTPEPPPQAPPRAPTAPQVQSEVPPATPQPPKAEAPTPAPAAPQPGPSQTPGVVGSRLSDEQYATLRDMVLKEGRPSISFVQRRAKIGFNLASEVIERMEQEGLIRRNPDTQVGGWQIVQQEQPAPTPAPVAETPAPPAPQAEELLPPTHALKPEVIQVAAAAEGPFGVGDIISDGLNRYKVTGVSSPGGSIVVEIQNGRRKGQTETITPYEGLVKVAEAPKAEVAAAPTSPEETPVQVEPKGPKVAVPEDIQAAIDEIPAAPAEAETPEPAPKRTEQKPAAPAAAPTPQAAPKDVTAGTTVDSVNATAAALADIAFARQEPNRYHLEIAFKPAEGGKPGILRIVNQDEEVPEGWQIAGRLAPHPTKDETTADILARIRRLPILGEKVTPETKAPKPTPNVASDAYGNKITTGDIVRYDQGAKDTPRTGKMLGEIQNISDDGRVIGVRVWNPELDTKEEVGRNLILTSGELLSKEGVPESLTKPEQKPTIKEEESRGERPGSTPEPAAAAPEPAPRGSDQTPEAVPPETRPTPEKPGPGEARPVREGTRPAGERAPRPAPEKRPESDRGGRAGERAPVSPRGEGEPAVEQPAKEEQPKKPEYSPTVSAPSKPSAPEIILGPDEKVGGTTEKTRYDANVKAISLVKELDRAGRMATPEEQRVLIQYSGWGSLKPLFDRNFEWDRQMQESRRSDYARYKQLKELLTPEEWETARQSSVNAHFTSPEVARAMWAALEHLGVSKVPGVLRLMETGMGTGIFFATQPPALAAKSARVGVEMDKLTGRIAQHLFQASKVYIQPLEATPLPENFFSLNIGNYPFFEVGVFDPQFKNQPFLTANVHNYFFARNMLALDEGGIIAVVTSRYTMDGAGQMATRFREWMEERGDLLGAIRLPKTAFQENAGTEVVTDIVFFRKRGATDAKGPESWVSTSQAYDDKGRPMVWKNPKYGEEDENIFVNDYFLRHPEMILGKPSMTGTMQKKNDYTIEPDGRDLGEAIKQAVAKLPEDAFRIKSERQKRHELIESEAIPAPGELLQGSYTVKDGKVYRKAGDQLVRQDVPIGQVAPTRALVKLRDAWRQVIRDQQDPGVTGEDVEKARKALSAAYTALVNEYGPLHGRKVKSFAFKDDPEFFNLLSVETWDADTQTAGKADILVKRTQFPPEKIQAVETAKDALLVTLNEMNEVNWSRMAELTGRPVDELQTELDGLVYENPEGDWETADAYLSGNVRGKLRAAEAAAGLDPKYQRNVEALRKVLPPDKEPKQIGVKVGSPWIPTAVYEDFLNYLADGALRRHNKATVTYTPLMAHWKVEVPKHVRNVGLDQTWGVTDRDGSTLFTADELIEKYMNLKDPIVWRRDNSTNPPTNYVDHEMTLAAKAKAQKINDEFRKWLWEDPERAAMVTARFNEELNATVGRKFDGSHLTLPGHATTVKGQPFAFRPHQKNAIWRGLQSANVLFAHDVGTGKTAIMAALAMELKRMGRAKKSMIVVPNNGLGTLPGMIASIYPSARILVGTADDLAAAKRQEFMGKVASGDWDTVIVAQSSFELLNIDPQRKIDFINQAIRQYEDFLMGLGKNAPNTRMLVKLINGLKTKLQKLILAAKKKDPGLTFEQLGIDALFVDESHNYANLLIATKMTNTKGVPSGTEADKSMDLFLKTRVVYEKTGGKNVFFFTGSPIRNTIAEVFNLSAYLQPDTLKAMQLAFFDAWASTFGLRTTNMEFTAAGTAQLVERFSKFQNMPALRQMQEEVMDYFPASEMPESAGIPKLKGGQAEVVSVESSPEHKRYLQHLAHRIEHIKARKGPPQKGDDIILTVNNDGRHVALDIRTRIPNAPDHPDSKVNIAVQNIYDIWKETKKERATQIVLCDIAVPQERGAKKAVGGPAAVPHFDVYKDMIDKLVKKGIPRDEIDYTQRVKGNREKLETEIFAKLRSGKLRVVFGHSKQLGISANVHDRLLVEHNIDVPYTADTMIQRYGRIVRQGNMHPEVRIINYVTKESFDAVMWGYVRNKAKNMSDYFAGRIGDGEFEDVGETRLNAEQIMAIATGRPEVMEHVAIQGKIRTLQSEKADWDRAQQRIAYEIATLPGQLEATKDELKLAEADGEKAKALLDQPKDLWEVQIDGTPYTEREAAGKRILELVEQYRSGGVDGAVLGNYGGLDVILRRPTMGEMGQALQTHVLYPYIGGVTHERFNTHEYKSIVDKQTGNPILQLQPLSPQGVMASLDAAVKRLRGRPDVLKEQAEKLEKTLAGYQKQGYGGEWPQQKDLDAAIAREAELAAILQTNADQGVVDNVVPGDVSDAKDEDAASTDKDTPPIQDEPDEESGGVTLGSGLGALQSIFERRRRMSEHRSPDPRVEAVLSGKARRGGLGRLAEAVQGYADVYAEEFVFGWAVRKWPQLRNDFRLAKDFHLDARRMAAEELVPILKDLTLPDFDTFSRLVYVRDLLESATRGEALPSPDPLNGAEPLTLEEVSAEKARLEAVQTPAVEEAIARHDALMHEHAEELVFRGELREDQARQNYMPHHVLDYTDRIDIPGLPRKMQKQWRSYTKKREGSERLIDMDYLKVMWTHLNKYHLHNLIDDFTLEKLQEYDATAEIRTELERRLTAQDHPQAEMVAAQWRPSPGERQQVGKQVYEGVQFQRGAPFHWTPTVPNGFIGQLVVESVNESGRVGDVLVEGDLFPETVKSQVGRALARGRNYRTYMIPVELAAAMRQFREPYHVNVFVQSARALQNVWKRVTLGAAGLPYEYANFLGDLENIMYEDARVGALPFFTMVGGALAGAALSPQLGMFGAGAVGMTSGWAGAILANRHMRRAFAASWKRAFEKTIRDPNIQRWTAEAEKQRVSQSGIYGSDIGSLLRLHPELRRFLPAMQRAWQSRANPRNLLQLLEEVRESTPRLAKFFADMERIEQGQPVRATGVKLEGLTPISAAGKVSREGPGDYGAVTQRYNNLFRGGLTPFSTWYHKMYWKFYERFRNKPGRMATKILLPLMAMWVWNNTYGEEQEKRLPYWFRVMPHINTMYQTEDGKDIIVTFQSSAAAAFRFIGLDLAPHLAGQVARGEKEAGEATVELLKNMGLAPAKETVRMLSPLVKAIPGFFGLVEGRGRTVDIPSRRFVPKSLEGSDEGRERAASYLLETFLSPYAQYLRGDRSDQLPEVRDPIIRTVLLGFADVPRATGYRIYDPYRAAEVEAWSRREDWTAEYAEAIEQGDFDKQQKLLAESQRLGMKPSKAAIQDTLRSRILFHRNEQRRKDERNALNP